MGRGRSFALLLSLLFICVTESIPILYCGRFVEGYDDPDIQCFVHYTSTVNLTLVTEAGVTRYLGSCHGELNCSSPYNSSTLVLNQYTTNGYVSFQNIGVEFSGNLTCQEVTTDGTVDSASCEINVVRVDIKGSDIEDDRPSSSYCYNYNATPSTVRWTLVTDSGQTLDLGTCDDVNSCTSPLSPGINLTRPDSYYSRVNFKNVHRNLTGQLSCSYTYNGSTQTDTQTLNVYHPATVENCSVDISRHNWSAILSCNITQVFSSAGLYDFTVFWDTRGLMFGGRRSYSNGLTSYVNTSDNQVYYNGSLTYSWRLPDGPVRYPLVYAVNVYYGHTAFRQYLIKKETVVARPDSPSTNCSELNHIPETGVVPCVCTADSLGSPPGRLLWLLGDTVMTTGDYNVSQLQFPSGQVSRQHDRMVATCQVDWVQPTSTQFTLHLAYGPDSLSLQVNQTDDGTVYVISPVTSVKPKTSDMVQWGGECQGQQGFTCTLTPSSAAGVDGKTVTCRVINAANNGHSAEASVIIRQQRRGPDPSQVQTNIEMRLRYVLVTVCSRVTENQVETQVHARVVKENQDWPGLCLDSTCTNAHVTATCDEPLSKSITAIVKIERVPATVTSAKSQASSSPRDVLFRAAVKDNAFDLETLNAVLDKADILVKTLRTCTPGYTYIGSRCAPDPSQVRTDIDMRLRYVLVTVCSRVTENQVETQVHARVVKENQDWPGLCLDSTCTNAHVTATCDGPLSKSISALVKIEQVPAKVTSAKTQASRSPRDVLFQAAVEDNAFDLETLNAVLDKTDVLIRMLQTCTPGYTYTGSNCVKDEEPSPDSAVLIGSVIGGVFAFLVVVIFIVLVVVVLRRLGRLDGGRRLSSGGQKQADDHDYTTLHFDQRGQRGQQDALELRPQGFDLNNPSFDQQDERPVSDYDFIAEDNPEIAKHLAESSQVDAEPDYVPPDYPRDDYCTLRNSDITSLDHSQDYEKFGSSRHDHGREMGQRESDDVTSRSPPETTGERDGWDYQYQTSIPPPDVEGERGGDYITPCSPRGSTGDRESSAYVTPTYPSESVREKESSAYISPTYPTENISERKSSAYIDPTYPPETVRESESSDYIVPK